MKTRILVVIFFVVGLVVGLAYAWLIEPVSYTESSPAQVMKPYKAAWLLMAAEAYAQDGDWERTQARLNSLRDAQQAQTLSELFDQLQAAGPNAAARALARLADRLNVRTPAMQVYLIGLISPTPPTRPASPITPTSVPLRPIATLTPTATPEPLPTVAPAATPIPDYQVIERRAECATGRAPQIRVIVLDELGQSVPGKEVWVQWDGGSDRFVTGFKPEIDPGYGDFDMQLDQSYNVSIGRPTSIVVSNLRAETCDVEGHTSWRLVFGPRLPAGG
jgi:hypothetical protein